MLDNKTGDIWKNGIRTGNVHKKVDKITWYEHCQQEAKKREQEEKLHALKSK